MNELERSELFATQEMAEIELSFESDSIREFIKIESSFLQILSEISNENLRIILNSKFLSGSSSFKRIKVLDKIIKACRENNKNIHIEFPIKIENVSNNSFIKTLIRHLKSKSIKFGFSLTLQPGDLSTNLWSGLSKNVKENIIGVEIKYSSEFLTEILIQEDSFFYQLHDMNRIFLEPSSVAVNNETINAFITAYPKTRLAPKLKEQEQTSSNHDTYPSYMVGSYGEIIKNYYTGPVC